mgnify:CR=1 FL=1
MPTLCQMFYIVQTKSPDDVSRVAKEAKAIQGVDNANFGGSDTEILMATMKRVQFWGIIATALLTIVAVLLISNTIRITIMSRATEIQIMRLVGAKNSYIRRPYLMEGAWIGALGAIIPSVLIYVLYHMVYSTFKTLILLKVVFLCMMQTGLSMQSLAPSSQSVLLSVRSGHVWPCVVI